MSATTCGCSFEDTPYLYNTCGATFTLFMGLLESILRARCDVSDPCNRAGRPNAQVAGREFDFIVVGAGVAGSVVAGRLAENPAWNVLLLEAGPEEPTATEVPAFAVAGVGTPLDWNYTTVAQENACLSSAGICKWPRGKMVSGTGSLHGMMYTRGHRSIYDSWAALGNEGWGYDDFLPYFIKAERNGNPDIIDDGYHGFDGPLDVQQFAYHPPLSEAIVEAAVELGYRQGDLNGANQTGANVAQMMVKDSLRASTPRVYLRPESHNRNLVVATHAHVTKVLINSSGNTAYGVSYIDVNGNHVKAYAKKEVILSAGAIGSPQLLLLSGVGPSEDLEALGIEVLQDLPVGKNIHNHVSTSVGFLIDDESTESLTWDAFSQFLNNRTGPLSGTGLTQTTAFLLSQYATDGVPDLQVFFDGYNAACSRTGATSECTTGELGTPCGKRYINARPTNVLPQSVGQLRLASTNPLDHPIIDPKYLTVEHDVDVLVAGIKLLINFTKTNALSKYNFTINTTPTAGCESLTFGSDEYWACHVKHATGPENHQGGSNRMGPAGDANAVVDPQLRVHGINALRVVDASVFPYMPNSNPVAAIIAAGEKGAEMIASAHASTTGRYPSHPLFRPAPPPRPPSRHGPHAPPAPPARHLLPPRP